MTPDRYIPGQQLSDLKQRFDALNKFGWVTSIPGAP
jgi:hypothetical protein